MAKYNKLDFRGGLNQFVDATKIDPQTEHYLLINGRVRNNSIAPIYKPLDLSEGLPASGDIQGVYPIDSYQIVFIGGKAWYRNFAVDSSTWNVISGLQMSATVEKIYLELVPASYVNFVRKAVSGTDAKQGVGLSGSSTGSPRAAIVMDGESQPWIIFPNATARVIQNYTEWNLVEDRREYVPAACILPMYFDGILYCVGKDIYGVYNQIYRSVSGRPIDFVIAVTTAGDKISADEAVGGAPVMAYRPIYDQITTLSRLQSAAQAFFVSSVRTSLMVIPNTDPTALIYGEPVYSNQPLFPIGALNRECVIDLTIEDSADTALIHFSGIRSFNGVMNLKFEGKNAPFSRWINNLIENKVQVHAAATTYDNYGVFALDTIYGPAILWYDTLTSRFVALDQFPNVGTVKQFSIILTQTERRLFFVTTNNKFFEYFGSTEIAPVRFYLKDFLPEGINAEHAIVDVRLRFSPALSSGHIQGQVLVDGRVSATQAQRIDIAPYINGSFNNIPYPISSDGTAISVPVQFGFRESAFQGTRCGIMLEWNFNAALGSMSIETSESTAPMFEQNKVRMPTSVITPDTVIFIGEDGNGTAGRIALNKAIKRLNPTMVIGCGNHAFTVGSDGQVASYLSAYWNNMRNIGKFYAVPGRADLSTSNGEPFFSALQQDPTRYFKISTAWADIFMMNAGYNNAGIQIEPDNLDGPTIETSKQMLWLRDQLAVSSKHKIVVWHSPPYCSVANDAAFQNIPLALWGASCHVGARHHLYERLRADDLTWFVIGTGSDDSLAVETSVINESQASKFSTLGYLQMRIWPLNIETSFVNLDGKVYDNFVIRL